MKRLTFFGCAAIIFTLLVSFTGAPVHAQGLSGRLVVYSAAPLDFADSLKRAFEALHPGTTVEIVNPGGAEAIIAKLAAERDNPQADVFHSGAVFEFLVAAKMGLLARTDPASIAPELPEALEIAGAAIPLYDEEGRWYVWGYSLGVIGYNERRLEQLGLPVPRRWQDLADPRYRGHIVFNMPQQSSSAFNTLVAHYQIFGEEGVWELWDAIDRNIAFYTPSTGALYSLVARGEVPISFGTARNYYVNRAEGHAVNVVYPEEGAWVFATGVGIVEGAKNRELAEAFVRFVLSPEGQVHAANHFQNPIRKGIQATAHSVDLSVEYVERTVPRIVVVDSDLAEEIREEVMRRFDRYTNR
ncbi:MAG TPA: extracellular solute-binding protein [Limnochordales bacterium]